MREAMLQVFTGLAAIIYIYTFEAIYRAVLGFNTGAVEVAIGAVSAITSFRAITTGVTTYATEKTRQQTQTLIQSNVPPSSPVSR